MHNGWNLEQSVKWLKDHSDNDMYKEKGKIRNEMQHNDNKWGKRSDLL